jgi:hypothetical protein
MLVRRGLFIYMCLASNNVFKLPCHPQWSREHVVPKSVLKDNRIANDPANIIGLPRRLNNARSNYKYIDIDSNAWSWSHRKPIFACGNCQNVSCPGVGYLTKEGDTPRFVPPQVFRRAIAQAALDMAERHPQHKTTIHARVLDLDLATEWLSLSKSECQAE